MRIGWKHFAAVAVAAPIIAIFVAWSGVINVGASGGHWKVTDWFLHYVMRQSVATYALPVERPETIDEALIAPAAGHYVQGCALCHGAPGEPRSASVMQMLPVPPDLTEVIPTWTDEELYRIVKHGVRFTGMPAWPTQERDDEVWGMVAFLRRMPDLDAEGYRALTSPTRAPASAGDPRLQEALTGCAACHGFDGIGRGAAIPVIAGQSEAYLLASLRAYADGHRPSGNMQTAATAVDPELFAPLAAHFASLPRRAQPASEGNAAGREIAEAGLPAQDVPACFACHGPTRNPAFPALEGLSADYIETQLELFADGTRGGTNYRHLMERAVKNLTPEQRRAVAEFFSAR